MDWINSRSHRAWVLFYGSAVLTAFTLVFPKLGWLEWVSLIPMIGIVFMKWDTLTTKQSYWHGFGAVYAYYFVIYHWFLALYPMDFLGLGKGASLVVVLAGWLGLSLLQALPGGLVFLGFRAICKTAFVKKHPIFKPLLFGSLWIVFEWSATLSWMGVPWGRLYMGQSESLSVMQISSVFGAYAVSFLLLAVNGFLAYALLYRVKILLCGSLSLGLLLGNLTFGNLRRQQDFETDRSVKAAVIQGNIHSAEKWDAATILRMMDVYDDLTRHAAEEGAEIVVWPETTITVALNRSTTMKNYVSDVASSYGVTLIVGALCEDETGEYNSLFLVSPDGEISQNRYDKRHLVPFGEYVPLKKMITLLIPPLAELSALDSDLTPGEDSALFETKWGQVGSLICFDSIYEMLGIQSVRDGAELMVISSNDSWFSDSAAVYQHQAQAQYRAIEEGRYLLRSANTGISTILTPTGEIRTWLEPLIEGYSVEEICFRTERTVYSVIGNTFVYLCGLFCIVPRIADYFDRRRVAQGADRRESLDASN